MKFKTPKCGSVERANFIHLTELSLSNFEVVKLVSEYFASKI